MWLLLVVVALCGGGAHAATLRTYTLVITDHWGAPDGTTRALILFNHSLPGPALHAEQGDTMEVTLWNRMQERTASLHFHGLVFVGQPWQDGVAMVTQCPVLPGTSWRYRFVVQQSAGTYWYHSHVAGQVGDGAFGAFVIHAPGTLVAGPPADDHIMAVTAWWARDQHSLLSQYHHLSQGLAPEAHDHLYFMEMTSALINGRARGPRCPNCTLDVLRGAAGKQLRLRFVSSCSPVPFRVSIENHTMVLVARDGKDVEPMNVTHMMLDTGQRLDVLVTLNQPMGTYWIRAEAIHVHGKMHMGMPGMHGITGWSLLRYDGAPEVEPPPPPNDTMAEIMRHSTLTMRAAPRVAAPPNATRTVVLNLWRKVIPEVGLRWHVNNGTLTMPSRPLLMSYYAREPVEANYVLHFEPGEVVDFILNNVGDETGPHPWHPHGHEAWFLGSAADVGAYSGQALQTARAPLCDVFTVPHNGWAAVRMRLDHSGVWLFHCHISFHHMVGMGVMLVVRPDLAPPPPVDWPECGSYPPRPTWDPRD